MAFIQSLLRVLPEQPWRWTTPPIYDEDGFETTPGVKQTLNGVFILFSNELITILRENLNSTQKNELATWVNIYTEEQCATWNVPLWAGETQAIVLRIPNNVWSNPTTEPPTKVKTYLQHLWRAANSN